MTLENLEKKLIGYNQAADVGKLRLAYDFAAGAHEGQTRISGEEFITHPLNVALILADLEMDLETLLAGLLHDVVEDTEVTLYAIKKEFGEEVALLVDGVTKLGKLEFRTKEEQQAENLRKMLLAMAKDIRVIIIKLADRLHNMRTLKFQTEAKQREIARETLEIYAPLAHRLGIYHLKGELEDLAFYHLNPRQYLDLSEQLAQTKARREEHVDSVVAILREKLEAVGIEASIKGRMKEIYSIYKKMKNQNKDLGEIYDVTAVRIVVNTVRDCYGALGIVHTIWKPIPGQFNDYIAMPKTNMYQSLHTTVIGPQGEPLEIQIRTWEMHRTAEYGISAHWRYKEGVREDKDFDKKLAWLRQLLEWQHDLKDASEFMESLKIDLFADAVFVFTPKGEVYELPAGSVPVDFAYRVHTQVGHSCIGAKVNGRIVPLDYKLKNGDIVEILTSKHPTGPSRDWLNIAQTSQAKNRIRQWFKREKRDENIARGSELLEREIKKQGFDHDAIKDERILEFGRKQGLTTLEDIFAAIGEGTVTALAVLGRLREDRQEKKVKPAPEYQSAETRPQTEWGRSSQGIKVRGVDNLLVRLAHCCNPIPGDPIMGYITRGRGVSIHRSDCRNINYLLRGEIDRIVEVAWENDFDDPFQVKLEVLGMNRTGLLSDVLAVLVEMKMNANWVTARGRRDMATIEIVLEMGSKDQLDFLMTNIRRVKDVYEIRLA